MSPVVLATGNPHKVEELRKIFAQAGIPVMALDEATGGRRLPEPAETGKTFEENATIKALAYGAALGTSCLADDSGLEVDALNGAPGVISSHYSTQGAETGLSRAQRDAANNARLLKELASVPPELRTARFVCTMALAGPDVSGRVRLLHLVRGTFEGRIGVAGDVPRPGAVGGFGYDPLFLLPSPDNRSCAELSSDEKNARSHRGAAARAMAAKLRG